MKELMKRVINWFRSQYAISKLRVKDGDVLVFRYKLGQLSDSGWGFINDLLIALRSRNIKGVHMFHLDRDCDLQSLSEEEMNRAGWFRKVVNPGQNKLLLNAYREKRKHDGTDGRPWDPEIWNDAEGCINRLESAIELEACRKGN